MAQDKESFISSEERPAVGLKPDMPISELRVRDLHALLRGNIGSKSKFNEKNEKIEGPRGKYEGWKDELDKMKLENEKNDQDYKIWSDQYYGGKPPKENETTSSGGERVSPAAMDQLIQTISGLSEQVTQLTQEVQKLKQRSAGG
jgi:hypothetical protein